MNDFGVINIGFDMATREDAVRRYVAERGAAHVLVIHPDGRRNLTIDGAEYVPFSETIMYRTFYPLLQRIDASWLLVMDECLRVKKRQDLHYNCIHHYAGQTPHKLVFETLPFIDEPDDYMILMDFVDKAKFRGRRFDESCFAEVPAAVNAPRYAITRIDCPTPPTARGRYEAEKQKLFAGLGDRDPDTIPNALQLFAGKFKSPLPGRWYVARNRRYKAANVVTFNDDLPEGCGEPVFIDLPLRQKPFNDFLARNKVNTFAFLHTGLKVDDYFFNRYSTWCDDVNRFNAQAGLRSGPQRA